MLCPSCEASHDSQVLRKRLSLVLFFFPPFYPALGTRRWISFATRIFAFLAAIKISRKSAASLSFRGYSYRLEVRSNGYDNADNNDIRDVRA